MPSLKQYFAIYAELVCAPASAHRLALSEIIGARVPTSTVWKGPKLAHGFGDWLTTFPHCPFVSRNCKHTFPPKTSSPIIKQAAVWMVRAFLSAAALLADDVMMRLSPSPAAAADV